ncbi:UTRA domain-containing protein, partial [Streptomyces sp. MT29]|nr:UTRA domain-containing protein [Streptomyces sp. MT29]
KSLSVSASFSRMENRPRSAVCVPAHTVAKVPELADDVRMTRQFAELYTERTGQEVVKGQKLGHARQASQDELDALDIDAPPHSAVAVLVTTVTFHDDDRPLAYWEDIYAPGSRIPIPD